MNYTKLNITLLYVILNDDSIIHNQNYIYLYINYIPNNNIKMLFLKLFYV